MKELMQHLLDGGKLVDERGYTLEQMPTGSFRVRYDDGDGMKILSYSEEFVKYLAEHTVEKIETYEDGFYWVMWEDDSVERRVAFHESKTWHKISHENGVLINNKNPHRVIERVEL